MLLLDVNVLVYAFRQDVPGSDRYAAWLEETINGETAYGISDLVLSGFLRIVTHPRILSPPATVNEALKFTETIRSQPQCITVVYSVLKSDDHVMGLAVLSARLLRVPLLAD